MQESPVESVGEVVVRLAQLQVRAADLWGVRVTKRTLVETAGISLRMIQRLSRPLRKQTIDRFDLIVLGKLCWFFGCEIEDLLAYLPKGETPASLPDIQVRRASPPLTGEQPPWEQTVRLRLPDVLLGERVVDIVRATGLKWDTSAAIRKGTAKRVQRATLVALCEAASQKGSRPFHMGEVLVYTGPRPWEAPQPS